MADEPTEAELVKAAVPRKDSFTRAEVEELAAIWEELAAIWEGETERWQRYYEEAAKRAERILTELASARAGAEGKWVAVEERMPEPTDEFDPGRNVLVVMELQNLEGLHVIDRTFWYGPGCDDGKSAWYEARGKVTHWMELPDFPPLPPAPKASGR